MPRAQLNEVAFVDPADDSVSGTPTCAVYGPLARATGAVPLGGGGGVVPAVIVIEPVRVAVAPPLSVTVSVIEYVPAAL